MNERFVLREVLPAVLEREREAALTTLRDALPHWAEIREVGSTAVDGVIGKGDIDVLVRVPRERFDEARACLDAALPRNENQLSNAIYQGYRVPSPHDVAVQLTVAGGPYDDFDRFLDALRADPVLVERYNALKRAHDGGPMDVYRAAKGEFIEAALRSG